MALTPQVSATRGTRRGRATLAAAVLGRASRRQIIITTTNTTIQTQGVTIIITMETQRVTMETWGVIIITMETREVAIEIVTEVLLQLRTRWHICRYIDRILTLRTTKMPSRGTSKDLLRMHCVLITAAFV